VGRRAAALVLAAVAVAAAGCGSETVGQLPPAAGPARAPALAAPPAGRVVAAARAPHRLAVAATAPPAERTSSGRALAVLSPRARVLQLDDPRTGRRTARAAAGVGPAQVAAAGDRLYVTDTRGGALLVFTTRPQLELIRRVYLPGGPYAIALDPARHRLWVTLTARNEVVGLSADGRPRALVRLPTVRQPDGVAVDPALGTVAVAGRNAGVLQLIDARRAYPADEG
jgi:DNA-binding beta-propeller fold protein YncE